MGRGQRQAQTTRDASKARRWAQRLEGRSWQWFTARRLAVGVVVAVVLLLSAQEWYQYRQVAHAGVPVSDCSSTERVVEYDVRWQWLPPGIVCVFGDGTTEYMGL